jgi:hypothetical protein
VLFSPDAVQIIDIFRSLGDFEETYDIEALDQLEAALACVMSRDDAKSVVSDALLLAFGLRRERREALDFAPVRSRRGTLDEYRLLALIGASHIQDGGLVSDAAASLDIMRAWPLVALASDIARRLEAAGLTLQCPDRRLLGMAGKDGALRDHAGAANPRRPAAG